jgi:PAS domain S-box-containing protein
VNRDGTVSYRNEQFTRVLGYTADDVPTLSAWYLKAYPDPVYREQVVKQWDERVRRSQEEHTDIRPVEHRVTCRNGEERIIGISIITLDDGFLATFTDLTCQKQVEQALHRRIVALTRPLADTGVSFEDIFDLDEIQTLQDEFAKATGWPRSSPARTGRRSPARATSAGCAAGSCAGPRRGGNGACGPMPNSGGSTNPANRICTSA